MYFMAGYYPEVAVHPFKNLPKMNRVDSRWFEFRLLSQSRSNKTFQTNIILGFAVKSSSVKVVFLLVVII